MPRISVNCEGAGAHLALRLSTSRSGAQVAATPPATSNNRASTSPPTTFSAVFMFVSLACWCRTRRAAAAIVREARRLSHRQRPVSAGSTDQRELSSDVAEDVLPSRCPCSLTDSRCRPSRPTLILVMPALASVQLMVKAWLSCNPSRCAHTTLMKPPEVKTTAWPLGGVSLTNSPSVPTQRSLKLDQGSWYWASW